MLIFNNLYTCRKTMKIYRGIVNMHSIAYKISQKSAQVKIKSEYWLFTKLTKLSNIDQNRPLPLRKFIKYFLVLEIICFFFLISVDTFRKYIIKFWTPETILKAFYFREHLTCLTNSRFEDIISNFHIFYFTCPKISIPTFKCWENMLFKSICIFFNCNK